MVVQAACLPLAAKGRPDFPLTMVFAGRLGLNLIVVFVGGLYRYALSDDLGRFATGMGIRSSAPSGLA